MGSELDRRFDEELGRITGPSGRLVIGRDELGRAIVENFPATLPEFFRTFCALNAANEAVVAGSERLTFADLDRISDKVAHGLVARGASAMISLGSVRRIACSISAGSHQPLRSVATAPAFATPM